VRVRRRKKSLIRTLAARKKFIRGVLKEKKGGGFLDFPARKKNAHGRLWGDDRGEKKLMDGRKQSARRMKLGCEKVADSEGGRKKRCPRPKK